MSDISSSNISNRNSNISSEPYPVGTLLFNDKGIYIGTVTGELLVSLNEKSFSYLCEKYLGFCSNNSYYTEYNYVYPSEVCYAFKETDVIVSIALNLTNDNGFKYRKYNVTF